MNQEREWINLSDSIVVCWDAIKTLKVQNEKLLVVLADGVEIQINGLPPRAVDHIFVAYSRYLRQHPTAVVPH